jgi:hypothetical protein
MVNRHRWMHPCRFPLRVVVNLGRGASILILYPALFGGITRADTSHHQLPTRAIVHGHNVQPRGDQLKALGYPDLTPQEAEEVDRLYHVLMNSSGGASRAPS